MFDLNDAVARWRQRLAAQPDFQAGDIDELEDHLREIVGELTGKGLDPQEAFLVAARRLGDPQALAGEFASADPVVRRKLRFRWIVVGAMVGLALMALIDLIGGLSLLRLGPLWVGAGASGWFWGILTLMVMVAGGLIIWRLLTADAVARRLFTISLWILALLLLTMVARVLLGTPGLTLIGLDGNSVTGETWGTPSLLMLSSWVRIALVALPALLLIGLLFLLERLIRR